MLGEMKSVDQWEHHKKPPKLILHCNSFVLHHNSLGLIDNAPCLGRDPQHMAQRLVYLSEMVLLELRTERDLELKLVEEEDFELAGAQWDNRLVPD